MKDVNFGDLLCLMLIYLKLTNQISWNWFWILSPFWIGIILYLFMKVILKRL